MVLVTLDATPGAVAQAAAPAAAPAPAQPSFAEARSGQTLPLRDLDFRRTADGAARVVVELPNNQVGVDIRNQGPNLVVEFLKSSLPEGLRRRLRDCCYHSVFRCRRTCRTRYIPSRPRRSTILFRKPRF